MFPPPSLGAAARRDAARRTITALVAAAFVFTLAPAGAGAAARQRSHRGFAATSTKRPPGRKSRCHRGSLKAHSSFAQYLLCVKDGHVRPGVHPPPAPPPPPPVAPPPPPPPVGPPPPPPPPPPVTKLTAAVYGDAPYGTTPTDTAEFQATPAFIDAVNADSKVQLVMHVGDIHSGKQFCTSAYDQSIVDLWSKFSDPLVYTPGDNEWADCHKAGEGGGTYNGTSGKIDYLTDANGNPVDYANGDPVANLDLVRLKLFPQIGRTLGVNPMPVLSQAQVPDLVHPRDRDYRENVMWEQAGVLFVTVDIPGGSNNDTDPWYGAPSQTAQQQEEVANRSAADVRWLNAAFAKARADGMKAMVIDTQADMWDLDGKTPSHLVQYDQFVDAVAAGTQSFAKPVLMFNGDSHVYKSDDPLSTSDPLQPLHPGHPDLQNFHRVVVHGSTTPLEYLRLAIDTSQINPTTDTSFGPFSWEHVLP